MKKILVRKLKNIIFVALLLSLLILGGCFGGDSGESVKPERNGTFGQEVDFKHESMSLESEQLSFAMNNSPITYRWEEVRKELGEEKTHMLSGILQNSQNVIDAWSYGTYEGKDLIGFRLYPDEVLNLLTKDFEQYKELFANELQEIQKKTKGNRFVRDSNGKIIKNPIPDDLSAMLFDINQAYESAIAEMKIQVHPTSGVGSPPDLTRTPAAGTAFEQARDVFQRYNYYLLGGKLEGFQTRKDAKNERLPNS